MSKTIPADVISKATKEWQRHCFPPEETEFQSRRHRYSKPTVGIEESELTVMIIVPGYGSWIVVQNDIRPVTEADNAAWRTDYPVGRYEYAPDHLDTVSQSSESVAKK